MDVRNFSNRNFVGIIAFENIVQRIERRVRIRRIYKGYELWGGVGGFKFNILILHYSMDSRKGFLVRFWILNEFE